MDWYSMKDSSRPEVLFLAHRFPYPPDKGDRIWTFHVLQWLACRARISLACLADEPFTKEAVGSLGRLCERVEVISLNRLSRRARALAWLARRRTATEGAFCRHTITARSVGRNRPF